MAAPQPGEIAQLAELLATGGWKELRVETPGFSLLLSTDVRAVPQGGVPLAVPAVPSAAATAVAPVFVPAAPERSEPAAAPVSAGAAWHKVTAPNLGTFYRAPKPGAAPFVEVGQRVEAATEICLLEVMKLFTSVKAGVAGTIRSVCVEDGVLVEGGEVLFLIEAA